MQQNVLEGFRLSPQQRKLWHHGAGAGEHRTRAVVRLTGRLDRERLRRVLEQIVERHESLRTVFRSLEGMELPIQVVEAEPRLSFEGTLSQRPGLEPPLHCSLVAVSEDEHRLTLDLPVLCADSRTLFNLLAELAAGYGGGSEAEEPAPAQYIDVSEWLNQVAEDPEAAAGLAYWQRIGQPEPAVDRLSFHDAGESSSPPRYATSTVSLTPELVAALEGRAAEQGVTLSAVFLGSWAALCQRLLGRGELVLGWRHHGRKFAELESALGPFALELPARFKIASDLPLAALWHQAARFEREADEWQEYFSWQADAEAGAATAQGYFPIGFAYERWPGPRQAGELSFALEELVSVGDRFEVRLEVIAKPAGMSLRLLHDAGSCRSQDAERLLERLQTLLASAAAQPEATVSKHALLSAAERHVVLERWNQTARELSVETLWPELFASQARRTPDAVALVVGAGRSSAVLSFAGLAHRARRLARRLRAVGVLADERVALVFERSAEQVVGALAVLEAGAAFAAIDPWQPPARLAAMLEEAGVRTVLSTERHRPDLPASVTLLCVDREEAPEADAVVSPAAPIRPEQLAYGIFTSGSTGRPKCVFIRHRSVINLLFGLEEGVYRTLGASRRLSLNAPLSFDAAIKQLIQLAHGHTLCLVPEAVRPDGEALARFLASQRVEVFDSTPSQLRLLLDAARPADLPQAFLIGGEAIVPALWRSLARDRDRIAFNLYGPTECTVDVTVCRISPSSTRPTLGRPLANHRVYLLDERLEPVPAGCPGELCVAGQGLARGYGRAGQSAERFVPDPFATAPGSRLYRSGDRAVLAADGNVDYLGRIDHQVKLRGFRLELGEIESVLESLPGVERAAAALLDEGTSNARLAAWVVPARTGWEGEGELRASLRRYLPEPMIPATIVPLDTLPLNQRGKIDRRALPAPETLAAAAPADLTAPASPFEEVLAAVWAEVLGLERIGTDQNFFDLGGHSLLATQLMARVRRVFQVEVPLRVLFDAPTISGLAVALAAVMDEGRDCAPPIVPVERDEDLPLSFAQQRLWYLDLLQPGSPLYNTPKAVGLSGQLDVAALAAAFSEIVRRHETLRTTFPHDGGIPRQVPGPARPLPLPVVDLSALPTAVREEVAKRQALAESQRPFALARGPLLRTTLLRLGAAEHVLLVSMHHITTDARSMEIFVGETAMLYAAAAAGRPSPLAELPIQYADFASFQRKWLAGERLADEVDWWRKRLVGASSLELPTDRPRTVSGQRAGRRRTFTVPAASAAALRQLGRRSGATPFMTLAAIFFSLLYRLSGQRDLVIGTPVANRQREELEGLIGCFLNNLVLRVALAPELDFVAFLERVREVALGAFTHQELPFEKIVEALDPERDLARNPLFQVLFSYQESVGGELTLDELAVEPFDLELLQVRFDLELHFVANDEELTGIVVWPLDLFDDTTIQRFEHQLLRLLEAVARDPSSRLAELPWLAAAERHQVVVAVNDTHRSLPGELCLHRLVHHQAATRPDAVAVVGATVHLSYGELGRRANRLAAYLHRCDVGPEARIAVLCERSPEQVVAWLGALTAGAAYVPVDPAFPSSRVAVMLEDAGAAVTLTPKTLATALVEAGEAIDGSEAGPENLAYVIFTSGSTGRPKGVQISHRAVVNFLAAMAREPGLTSADRWFAVTTPSFDIAALEIFLPLVLGATVELADRTTAGDGVVLAERLALSRATVMQATPASWQMLLASGWGGRRGLRILCGGEALPQALAASLLAAGDGLWNLYGPTETTIWSACGRIEDRRAPITLGRPITNTALYVLDSELRPLPIGVVGGLFIAGAGLSRGYIGAPRITAERFLPDPFREEPGARLYATGDRARRLTDGSLDFLGRADHQVKIRGFRIELEEIEASLAAHPEVRAAAVAVRELGEDRRLTAYLVAESGGLPKTESLLAWLGERLPAYMLPAGFVVLDALPLTPNGKLDRRALPAPEPQRTAQLAAPRTPLEMRLAGFWCELFGLDEVSIHEGFFTLGGHSLLATRLLARLRAELGCELPLRALYPNATIAELAARLVPLTGAGAGSIPRRSPRWPVPASFAQRRMWFVEQLTPGRPTHHLFQAARLQGTIDPAVLGTSLAALAARQQILATVLVAIDGEPYQQPMAPAVVPLAQVDLRQLPAARRSAQLRQVLRAEAERPFVLDRGPLWRVLLLPGEGETLLFLTMHHLIGDGWSTEILVRELTALYAAQTSGAPAALSALPIQFADFAAWQHEALAAGGFEEHLDYWREQLAGAPATLELPFDRRPARRVLGRSGRRLLVLPPTMAGAVRRFGQEHQTTPFTIFIALFKVLLTRLASTGDVLVSTPVAGRSRLETQGLIGLFVDNLVLRTDLSGNPSFAAALARVRRVVVEAQEHQELPFETLVEALQPERGDGEPPWLGVVFAHRVSGGEGEGAAVSYRPKPRHARFPLFFQVVESDAAVELVVDYVHELFDGATLGRWLSGYSNLLAAALAAPEGTIAALPLLGGAARHQLGVEWNDTEGAYPGERSPTALFRAQAARAPDAVALVSAHGALTYGALAHHALSLARRLCARGVSVETPVVLAAQDLAELVVGALGILAAGGAYVPLDPDIPAERAGLIVNEVGAWVLVGTLATVPADLEPLAAIAPADECRSHDQTPLKEGGGDTLAYVMYTSGSTGRPKGVAVNQRAIVRLVCETDYVQLAPGDRLAQASNSAFDAATFEVWGALLNGGTVIEVPRATALAPRALAAALCRQRIDTLFLTTALFNEVMSAEPTAFGSLRTLLFGGEAVDPGRVRRCLETAPPQRLLHVYGPTESTTFATWQRVRRVAAEARTVPIGLPIANTRLLLLDHGLAPVLPGAVGEIYLGGDGLARGYYGCPAASAERFVPDPHAARPGARLYRTGDLARQLPTGQVEFMGRGDHQVKIRGFRIELGEIEAVLERHPTVMRAVVLARGERSDERRLLAFIVARVGASPPAASMLKTHLRTSLPAYMVPHGFILLAELPLNPNGKIDRGALLEIAMRREQEDADHGASEDELALPRDPFEESIAEVWAEVLRVRWVDTHSNFFALGGHSLLATQVVSRLQRLFDIDLPLRDLFEAPTVAGLATRLEARLAQGVRPPVPPLVVAARSGDPPLSFAQQRLWFLDRFEGGSAAYNVPLAVQLSGRLDVSALAAALSELVGRHEVLRTSYPEIDGRPVQRIAAPAPVALPLAELSALPAAARGYTQDRLLAELAQRAFDLAVSAPLRLLLVRIDADEHVLGVVVHHLACDGWSLRVIVHEVAELYEAFVAGRPSSLAPLALQYADFALWQRRWLRGEALASMLDFWRGAVGDTSVALELPTDRPRPAVLTLHGASRLLTLPETLVGALTRLARDCNATLFMVFFAAFSSLLHRLTGQTEMRIATPIAGRHRIETEGLIGLLINLLMLRTTPRGEMTFSELVAEVRERALAAYLHQDLPFEKLVEELAPNRDLSRQPLCQVVLMFQNLPRSDASLTELELEPIPVDTRTAKFELTLTLSETAYGLSAALEYNRDLFDSTTAVRMLAALRRILEGAVAAPECRLIDLPWLGAAEQHQLLTELANAGCSAVGLGAGPDLVALLAGPAAAKPDAVAVRCGAAQLSYCELEQRVMALARALQARGVGPEVRVGVAIERSLELPIALAAVLAAGGAWVPLDPSYPRARLEHVVADSKIGLVLTTTSLIGQLSVPSTLELLCLDRLAPAAQVRGEGQRRLPPTPSNLAYIIYTSGSTGRPKGVQISRRAVHNFLASMAQTPGFAPSDRLLAVTTPAFDIAVLELLLPLAVGGEVEIVPAALISDGLRLLARLEASRASAMQATPATWRMLLEAGWSGSGAMRVLCGGEALPAALAAELRSRGRELWNLYGPTETTVWSTCRRIDGGRVTVGRPIAATQIHVLDRHLQPAPLGVPGALLIGGAGLARGYLGRPGLTAERFIPDPFGERSGARLYFTGDRARRRGDGETEILGRLDHQLKVRGFRIEPAEVEAALERLPGVSRCAVVARGAAGGEGQLVAHVVTEGAPPLAATLREGLRDILPEHMVPSLFVPLEALPLTPNGKVDRGALPMPSVARKALGEDDFVAPRTPREAALAEVWCAVLELDEVGAHDNFFTLGGDSLRGLRVIALARQAGLALTPRQLFQHPTLEGLAAVTGEVMAAPDVTVEDEPVPAGLELGEAELEAILEGVELEGMEG